MHQRHVIAGAPAPCCAGPPDHLPRRHHASDIAVDDAVDGTEKDKDKDFDEKKEKSMSGVAVRRTRRKQASSIRSWWPFRTTARRKFLSTTTTKKNPSSSSFTPLPHLVDMDLLATFLQILSALIMMGCAVTLLSQAFSSPTTGNGHNPNHRGGGAAAFDFAGWFSPSQWVGGMTARRFGGVAGPRGGSGQYGIGLNAHYPKTPLKPSSFYTIPGSMSHLGDKSDRYALLRKEFDEQQAKGELPNVEPRFSFAPITTMNDNGNNQMPLGYDVYNCPDEPPSGYPYAWNLLELLKAWPPDDPTPRPQVYQGLCVFDYMTDLEKAYTYRDAELPFVIRGDPQVQSAVQRWNAPQYMERLLGNVNHRTEYSESNHFLYWNPPPRQRGNLNINRNANNPMQRKSRFLQQQQNTPQQWKQPTEMMRMTYAEWLTHANSTDDSLLGPTMPHWYFRLIGCGETGPEGQCDSGSSEYLFDELTFFQPKSNSLYMTDPDEQKGIHCRFGMKGVIAENHFDGSRNMIAVLGGERRYILAHPEQCPYLSLLPKGHPSARHSAVDWSEPDLDAYPEFALARGNEVVLQAGDVLYLPTNWFHYIISLSLNFQCNTRSGIGQEYMEPIHQCGF